MNVSQYLVTEKNYSRELSIVQRLIKYQLIILEHNTNNIKSQIQS